MSTSATILNYGTHRVLEARDDRRITLTALWESWIPNAVNSPFDVNADLLIEIPTPNPAEKLALYFREMMLEYEAELRDGRYVHIPFPAWLHGFNAWLGFTDVCEVLRRRGWTLGLQPGVFMLGRCRTQ